MDRFLINVSLLLLSSMFCVLSSEWFLIFLTIEINSFSFSFFLLPKINSIVKYFLIQGVGSLFIIIRFFWRIFFMNNITSWLFLWVGCILKLASIPFFIWFPNLCINIRNVEMFFILSWQKLIPLWLTFLINVSLLLLSSMFCVLSGGLFLLNNSIPRLLLVYSSLSFSGWLIIRSVLSSFILMFSFFIYLVVIFILIKERFSIESMWFRLINYIRRKKILIVLFSLGGIPPFLGFIPKWIILLSFTVLRIFLVSILIVLSLLNIFCYLKIFSSILVSEITKEEDSWVVIFLNVVPLMLLIFLLGPKIVGSYTNPKMI